jgi:hypothetical protein
MSGGSSVEAGPTRGRIVRATSILLLTAACGWFVMEMEILGGRILAPYFGSAVYVVMGSVIGVFLLSLSAGYMLGGWLSRTRASKWALALALTAAGAWLCVLPSLVGPVCDGLLDLGFGVKGGSLLAAFALFGVPTVLLGTVSPTAVRWLTARAADAGLNAGVVFAVSTVASFAGCLMTAFYLVLFSMRRTIRVSGALVIVLGAVVALQAALGGRGSRPERRGPRCEG